MVCILLYFIEYFRRLIKCMSVMLSVHSRT